MSTHNHASRKAAIFNMLKQKFPNGVISDSVIRMEAKLINGKSEYEFFHKQLGNESATEKKLNEQDAFRMTDWGIFLMAESTTIPGISVPQTYPNPFVFPDEAGFTQTAHLEHIYNGHFTARVGDTIYINDMPIMDCRVVNTAQQSPGFANSERRAGDGFIQMTPQYTFKGRENNILKLIVPANSSHKVESNSAASGYVIKLACIIRGYKITGAGNL